MNKIKQKYLTAIYIIVAFVALILGVFGYYSTGIKQDILLNLSSDLLSVVLVFFLVGYFFSLKDWNLSEKVNLLVDKLNNPQLIFAKDFFLQGPNLSTHIKDSQTIDISGFSLSYVLYNFMGQLKEHVIKGKQLRIIVSDPRSDAIKMSVLRSEIPDDIQHFEKRLSKAIVDIEYLFKQSKLGNNNLFEIRVIPFAPNFAIYSFNKNLQNAKTFIEVYPHKTGFGSQPWFYLDEINDRQWYEHFTKQFDDLWDSGTEWKF